MLQEDIGPLSGSVEMDETYMGGVRKYRTGRPMRGDKKKTPVVGLVERKRRAKAFTLENLKGSTLLSIAREHTLPESTVYTDELPAYDGIQYMRNRYTPSPF